MKSGSMVDRGNPNTRPPITLRPRKGKAMVTKDENEYTYVKTEDIPLLKTHVVFVGPQWTEILILRSEKPLTPGQIKAYIDNTYADIDWERHWIAIVREPTEVLVKRIR